MAQETDTVIVKLDPEQLAEIKKNYLDMIDRVIQERQEIKGKMERVLQFSNSTLDLFRQLYPEYFLDDKPDLRTNAGFIPYNLLEIIQLVKQVYDSIQNEVNNENPKID